MAYSGFVEEGVRKKAVWKDGAWIGLMAMAILEDEVGFFYSLALQRTR